MYSEKILMIPDYVLPRDVPAIYNYFKTFNIADVESVEYRDHEEPEYWVEDKPFYGYAIIKINNWHDNTCTYNFYQKLIDNSCKMVYDDPYYWNLQFYNPYVNYNNSPDNIENNNFNLQYQEVEHDNEDEHQHEDDHEDDYDEYYSGDEKDDVKDKDYEYCDTDDEKDRPYEYDYLYSKLDKKITVKTKNKPKTNYDNTNKNITELLTSKNYMKKNKRKEFKNVWVRRLRQKTN